VPAPTPPSRPDLNFDLTELLAMAGAAAQDAQELETRLRQVYRALYNLDLSRYDIKHVKADAPHLMQALFTTRLKLRQDLPTWHLRGLKTSGVIAALRDLNRILRYAGDMLGELAIDHRQLPVGDKPARAFSGTTHNTFVHPSYADAETISFQTGDVLLVRGTAHNSAAIARIGDTDTQFSHIGIVHVDGDGRHLMVEALIEDGAIINTLHHAVSDGVGRAVLYRHKDPDLAAKAAALIHDRVKLSRRKWLARRIPYDFSMRLNGTSQLFCSKLVHLAFKDASGGTILLPPHKTRLDMKNRDFFRRIGVKASETFAPGDIDIDPQFELIAEWQDYRVTPRLRAQDMVMTKIFEWMDSRGARFEDDWKSLAIGWLGRISSHLHDDIQVMISDVVPRVPLNMSRRCVATIAMLHQTCEGLVEQVQAREQVSIKSSSRPLHPRDALAHLELVRDRSNGKLGYLVER
jgi:hypothetical protein